MSYEICIDYGYCKSAHKLIYSEYSKATVSFIASHQEEQSPLYIR